MEGNWAIDSPSDQLDAVNRRGLFLLTHRLLGALLLLAFSPLLLVISGLVILLDGRPIFFAHYRVGAEGRLFRCFKFRTMRVDAKERLAELLASDAAARAEWERDRKLVNDPRITRVGHFLRKTSLDELPQLFNVVRGEMVLVGPRPITVPELQRYGLARWHYLSVPPGMTGLWQVSGRNNTSYEERVALDRYYVENRSIGSDLKILLLTIKVVFTGHGAR